MPFEELPFPIVETVDQVVREMSVPVSVNKEFIKSFCPNGAKNSCEKLFELMVTGKSDFYRFKTPFCYCAEQNTDCLCTKMHSFFMKA